MSETGKEQKPSHSGKLRIEYANNRIIVDDGKNIRLLIDGDKELITIGQNERIAIDGANERISMKDNSNINRILLDSNAGIFKLSQSGENVLTAPDDKLIWSSDFNMFKIVGKYTGAVAGFPVGNGVNSSITITHNLGYKPTFIGTITLDDGTIRVLPYFALTVQGDASGTAAIEKSAILGRITDTVLYIMFSANDDDGGRSYFNGSTVTVYAIRETAD